MKAPPAELAERLWDASDEILKPGVDMRIDDLAALVGVPRATLYYYFSGKDDVFEFLLAQKLQRGTASIAARSTRPATQSNASPRSCAPCWKQRPNTPNSAPVCSAA